jgi:hypothetical protein
MSVFPTENPVQRDEFTIRVRTMTAGTSSRVSDLFELAEAKYDGDNGIKVVNPGEVREFVTSDGCMPTRAVALSTFSC